MDGGEQIFDIAREIAKAINSVHKPSELVRAEDALARNEAAIAAIRAEIAQLNATGKTDAAGAATRRLVAAMAEAGQLMNASQPQRADFYEKRAEALGPTHQRAVDAIGAILDLALPGTSWVELMSGERMRALVAGVNRIGITTATWCDRAKFVLPVAREDAFRSLIGRHRSR
jgi:hypothetical protein